MATNDDTIIGINDAIEISIMNTSIAKMIPVIGAWKIDARAAAHPIPHPLRHPPGAAPEWVCAGGRPFGSR